MLETAARAARRRLRVRQNLALAYALAGDWAEARTIAAQDVPADQLDARIQQWMQLAKPSPVGPGRGADRRDPGRDRSGPADPARAAQGRHPAGPGRSGARRCSAAAAPAPQVAESPPRPSCAAAGCRSVEPAPAAGQSYRRRRHRDRSPAAAASRRSSGRVRRHAARFARPRCAGRKPARPRTPPPPQRRCRRGNSTRSCSSAPMARRNASRRLDQPPPSATCASRLSRR